MARRLKTLDINGVPERIDAPLTEGRIRLKEMEMQYYVIGDGSPIIAVHCNGGDHTGLEDLARRLAHEHKVYLIESRCHGKSSVTEKITFDLMAEDIHDFIEAMGIEKPIVIGHSDGGVNGLILAIRHPDDPKAVMAFGANAHPFGVKFPLYLHLVRNYRYNPIIINEMLLKEPHISRKQLRSIRVPTYIVVGENDLIRPSHTRFLAKNIPDSHLAVLADQDHSSYVHDGKYSYNLVKEFLEKIK